jgi:hypothetical protein
MSRLEIKRLDSPLARGNRRPDDPAGGTPQPDDRKPEATPRSKRRAAGESNKPRLASVPQAPQEARAAKSDPFDGLPDPPALNESLELLSTRLPTSLRRSLSELTSALRARGGERVSQKGLPEQEVLAVLIWLASSAENSQAVARLGAALDAYRARRYAAAAEALRPSAPVDESP